jgi:hypothetical protein
MSKNRRHSAAVQCSSPCIHINIEKHPTDIVNPNCIFWLPHIFFERLEMHFGVFLIALAIYLYICIQFTIYFKNWTLTFRHTVLFNIITCFPFLHCSSEMNITLQMQIFTLWNNQHYRTPIFGNLSLPQLLVLPLSHTIHWLVWKYAFTFNK